MHILGWTPNLSAVRVEIVLIATSTFVSAINVKFVDTCICDYQLPIYNCITLTIKETLPIWTTKKLKEPILRPKHKVYNKIRFCPTYAMNINNFTNDCPHKSRMVSGPAIHLETDVSRVVLPKPVLHYPEPLVVSLQSITQGSLTVRI